MIMRTNPQRNQNIIAAGNRSFTNIACLCALEIFSTGKKSIQMLRELSQQPDHCPSEQKVEGSIKTAFATGAGEAVQLFAQPVRRDQRPTPCRGHSFKIARERAVFSLIIQADTTGTRVPLAVHSDSVSVCTSVEPTQSSQRPSVAVCNCLCSRST